VKIALIGGSGFIGSATSRLLEVHGHDFTIIDKRKTKVGSKSIYCNVLDSRRIQQVLKGFDIVYMFAAISNSHDNRREPVHSIDTNVMGLTNVLNACVANNVKRIVFCSSVWVYSTSPCSTVHEETPLDINLANHIYTSTKMSGEMLVRAYHSMFGLDYTIVRYGPAYGPGANLETALSTFFSKVKNNEPITIYGDGEQFRNFMHVTDHARANLAVLNDKCTNEVINFDGSDPISLNNIIQFIEQKTGSSIKAKYKPAITGDYRGKIVSRRKAKELLGWNPVMSFEEGASLFYEQCMQP